MKTESIQSITQAAPLGIAGYDEDSSLAVDKASNDFKKMTHLRKQSNNNNKILQDC
jgi:hypothetical protein